MLPDECGNLSWPWSRVLGRLPLPGTRTTYVGDVREPLSFTELTETRGMVREAIPVISRKLLVLITYCDIVAVGKSGLAWQTSQIAVDGFSVKTVDGDRITGVSDADWHPAPFSVRLSDGFLFGGNQT